MNTQIELPSELACHLETFATHADFNTRAAGLHIAPRLWDILLALDGRATAATLAGPLGMPPAAVHAGLLLLEQQGLVSKITIQCPWSLQESTAAEQSLTQGSAPATVPEVPDVTQASKETAVAAPGRAAQPPAPAAAPQTRKASPVKVSLRSAKPAAAATQPPAPIQTAAPAPEAAAASAAPATPSAPKAPAIQLKLGAARRKPSLAQQAAGAVAPKIIALPPQASKSWRVQPVLDALRAKAGGDPMVGQLLAYRVFLRVPGELLQEAGIRSVCLIEPDLVIRDPRLKMAIEKSLLEVAGLPWPSPEPAAA